MKPKFKNTVKNTSGIDRKEGLVYCNYNDGELVISKHLPKRKTYPINMNFGLIGKNLRELFKTLSPEYKSDLASYTLMYHSVTHHSQKANFSYYVVYTKMMWALRKQFPDIDLLTISREDIFKHEYPMRSIQEGMKSGLLLEIDEAQMLKHEM